MIDALEECRVGSGLGAILIFQDISRWILQKFVRDLKTAHPIDSGQSTPIRRSISTECWMRRPGLRLRAFRTSPSGSSRRTCWRRRIPIRRHAGSSRTDPDKQDRGHDQVRLVFQHEVKRYYNFIPFGCQLRVIFPREEQKKQEIIGRKTGSRKIFSCW